MAEIIDWYMRGTDFGIGMDGIPPPVLKERKACQYGPARCGGTIGNKLVRSQRKRKDLDQVTWMDVRVGDILPTPRHGKPVEINAYWYSASWKGITPVWQSWYPAPSPQRTESLPVWLRFHDAHYYAYDACDGRRETGCTAVNHRVAFPREKDSASALFCSTQGKSLKCSPPPHSASWKGITPVWQSWYPAPSMPMMRATAGGKQAVRR